MAACVALAALARPAAVLAAQAPDTTPPPADTIPPPPPPPDTIPPPPPPPPPDTIPPVPPDTIPPVPPDTIPPVPPDTIPPTPPDTVPVDTVPPEPPREPPVLGPMRYIGPTGWAVGAWEWQRADLMRLPDLSLLHLLERVPGVTPARVASVGQPEGAAVFGSAAGAIRYEIDGFELDPLVAPTFDPSRFPLVALESVRIERTVTGATVRIRTLTPRDARPQTVIEAGTGDLRTNLFRGTFLAPRILDGGLGLGFENLGAQTITGDASNQVAGWLKWTWARDESGVQLEYRQVTTDRTGVGQGLDGTRRDWVARARHRFGALSAEAYAGASNVEDQRGGEVVREGSPQVGLRVRVDAPAGVPIQTGAALRFRDHPRLPAQELEVSLWSEPTPWLGAGGELRHGRWAVGAPTRTVSGRVRAGPFFGFSAFAGASTGSRALAFATPFPGASGPGGWRLNIAETGLRAGIELDRRDLHLGLAAIRNTADSVPGFGLPFDPEAVRLPGGTATGVEAVARLPTGWAPLRVEGSVVAMDVPGAWPYLPAEQWRIALVYHHLPLPSGNLEIYARADHGLRGAMNVATADAPTRVGAYRATDLELSIRVLEVHAFLRWQNVFNRPFQEDVADFPRPGQHVFYGVKWQFWN
jgi:hypothetical protein